MDGLGPFDELWHHVGDVCGRGGVVFSAPESRTEGPIAPRGAGIAKRGEGDKKLGTAEGRYI